MNNVNTIACSSLKVTNLLKSGLEHNNLRIATVANSYGNSGRYCWCIRSIVVVLRVHKHTHTTSMYIYSGIYWLYSGTVYMYIYYGYPGTLGPTKSVLIFQVSLHTHALLQSLT